MNQKQTGNEEVSSFLNRIKDAGPIQGVDFEDAQNSFMVWTDHVNGVQYCGGRPFLNLAVKLAGEHVNLTNLYIVRTNPPAVFALPGGR